MQDSTDSLKKTAHRFFSGTLLSRIAGMLRDISMAYVFGTGSAVAAFLVAFRFSHLLRRLFGEGALQSAFIPHFESLRKEDPKKANQFFIDLFGSLSLFLIIIIVLTILALLSLLYFFDFSDGNREVLFLTSLLMPSLLFICLFGLNASLLQCEKSYFTPGVAPVAFNLIWVLAAFGLQGFETQQAMPLLAFFVILACLGQWLITAPSMYKIIGSFKKIHFFSPDVKRLFKPLFLGILGVAASQVNNALDAVFARWVDNEGPAFLWYAIRLQQLPLALFGVALSGALLPPLSRALKNEDINGYGELLTYAIKKTIAFIFPITLAVIYMGDSIVNLIYGHGDFSFHSIIETTKCLWGYALGLLPMVLILILAPGFYAQKNVRTPAIASMIAMAANIFLNALFITYFQWGAVSIAIATSISALINLLWLYFTFPYRSIPTLSIGKVFLVTSLAFIFSLFFESLFFESTFLQLLFNKNPSFPTSFSDQLFTFTFQGVIFSFFILFNAILFKCEEILDLLPFRKHLGKAFT
jgi:putative peptidoglycan lipid II flippase